MGVAEIIEIVQTGGPYSMTCLMIYMWWSEKCERKDANAALLNLTEASITGSSEITRVLDRILDKVTD